MSVTNISNKETTLKSMLSLMNSDNYTIDRSVLYCNYKDETFTIEFGSILDNYRDYFERYLVDSDVPESMYYQPAAFAEKLYGTPDLDFLILYFAKMVSLFEFKKPKIKVLPKHKLLEINRLFVEYKSVVDNSYKNPTKFIEEIE